MFFIRWVGYPAVNNNSPHMDNSPHINHSPQINVPRSPSNSPNIIINAPNLVAKHFFSEKLFFDELSSFSK